jgi:hypothetical protein
LLGFIALEFLDASRRITDETFIAAFYARSRKFEQGPRNYVGLLSESRD